jgi:hypothetical protein
MAYLLILAWMAWTPVDEISITLKTIWDLVLVAVVVVAFIGTHELLHCLRHPGCGFLSQSIIGLVPAHCMPYAAYIGGMNRGRFVICMLLPLLTLSVLPLLVCVVAALLPPTWPLAVSVLNALGSAGDIVILFSVLARVPSGAMLRDDGWGMSWAVPSQTGTGA